jgi:hypothetical protein
LAAQQVQWLGQELLLSQSHNASGQLSLELLEVSVGPSSITATDIDTLGNIVVGGYSQDSNLLSTTTS